MAIRTISNIVIFTLFFSFNIAYAQDVLINEIAWMGTKTSANDEWIELYNPTSIGISLEKYILVLGEKEIPLQGTIKANSFYILERTDDNTLPNIKADLIYTGSIKNTGLKIYLKKDNILIDEANFENGWTAGDNETKQTAERVENTWQTSINEGGSPNLENILKIKEKDSTEINSFSEEIEKTKNFPLETVLGLSFISGTTLVFLRKQIVKKEQI